VPIDRLHKYLGTQGLALAKSFLRIPAIVIAQIAPS
jgi:hypothetical protein